MIQKKIESVKRLFMVVCQWHQVQILGTTYFFSFGSPGGSEASMDFLLLPFFSLSFGLGVDSFLGLPLPSLPSTIITVDGGRQFTNSPVEQGIGHCASTYETF